MRYCIANFLLEITSSKIAALDKQYYVSFRKKPPGFVLVLLLAGVPSLGVPEAFSTSSGSAGWYFEKRLTGTDSAVSNTPSGCTTPTSILNLIHHVA